MKLSTFQLILLVTFGALGIAGVLIFAFAVGSSKGAAVGNVVIWGTFDDATFANVVRAAADDDTRLSGVTYEKHDPVAYESDLTEALASGKGPDLFIMRQDFALHDAGKVGVVSFTEIPVELFQQTFVDSAAPYIVQNGTLGLPFLVDPLVLYYNKDILASAGYAKPPAYWDELFDMSKRITQRDDSGNISKSTIPLGEYQNIPNAKDVLSVLIIQAGGSITTKDTAGHLTSSLAAKNGDSSRATETALRFYTEFADPSKDDYSWNRSLKPALNSFSNGDVALYVGYASERQQIARTNPNLSFALAPLPQIRNVARTVDTGHTYALAISRTSKNVAGALTVAKILVAQPMSLAFSTAYGIPSARRDILDAPATGDMALFNKEAIITHSWTDPDPDATSKIFKDMIENTTSGASLLTEAVLHADKEITQLLGL